MKDPHQSILGLRALRLLIPLLSLCLAIVAISTNLNAQQEKDPQNLDPADIFFQAWLTVRDAEKLEKEESYSDAWKKYRQAANYYDVLSKFHANWKPELVQSRVKSTSETIKSIEPKAAAELAEKHAKTKDLVEGGSQTDPNPNGLGSGQVQIPSPRGDSSRPTTTPQNAEAKQRLQILELDQKRLKEALLKAQNSPADSKNAANQARLSKQIQQKDSELSSLRNILSRAPLQKDMENLTRQNRTIKAEINITARALKESQKRLNEAQKIARKHKEDAELAQRRTEQIQRDMDAQKKIDNQVVVELRKELKNVTLILDSTRKELGIANAQVEKMKLTLAESQATIEELTKERDDLRAERSTLLSILKKNDSTGVQKVIAENMRLGKELQGSLDRLEHLKNDNNTTKDTLVAAQRDLAIAKNRIIQYQQEQSEHGGRVKALEDQLRDAEAELAGALKNEDGANTGAKTEEVNILRSTVNRLMSSQERRRTAEKLLWETYQKSQTKILGLPELIRDIRNTKVELTQQEKNLIDFRQPDSEFTSPQRVSFPHAQAHATALEEEMSNYNPLMRRAFEKGRFEAARQILEDMDERFPGHFPTLCNRGVVEIKTADYQKAVEYFTEAITMRENSSYAHHMLGFAYYQINNLDKARKSFQRTLQLKTDNAGAHIYLGNLAGAGRRYQKAEEHYQKALLLSPTSTEAYFNLSVLSLQQQKKKAARDYYAKALDHGLSPNPAHEHKLTQ